MKDPARQIADILLQRTPSESLRWLVDHCDRMGLPDAETVLYVVLATIETLIPEVRTLEADSERWRDAVRRGNGS